MKLYAELTHRGRLRRLRGLAEAALAAYGLDGARCRLIFGGSPTLYRITDPRVPTGPVDDGLFEPGQYLLRVYPPGWQTAEAVEVEMAWLAALRGAGLPVPEPVARLESGWLTYVTHPGVPETRFCALLRWIKGRLLANHGRPEHYRAQGRLMAHMHNLTQEWPLPPGHQAKRRYDWDGLFMNDPEIGLARGECWGYLPPDWVEAFQAVTHRFRQLADDWGTGPEVWGLIHADLGLDANLLFWQGQPRPIDFDGSGFGYWMYDLAVALAHCAGTANYARFRDALFEGYAEHRHLPAVQLDQLALFTAAFYVYYTLWMVGVDHLDPGCLGEETEEVMYRGAAFVLNYVR